MGAEALDGVSVFNPDGKPIGRISMPERVANVCFGGAPPQPPVHGGEHVAVFAVRQYPGVLTPSSRWSEDPGPT